MYLRHGLSVAVFAGLHMNTVLVEMLLVLSHRLFFSHVSLGTISDAKFTVRPILSHENLNVRYEIHGPTITVSDVNLIVRPFLSQI